MEIRRSQGSATPVPLLRSPLPRLDIGHEPLSIDSFAKRPQRNDHCASVADCYDNGIVVIVHPRGAPYFVPRDPSSYLGERLFTLDMLPGSYYIAPVEFGATRARVPMATFQVGPHSHSYLGELHMIGSCDPNDLRLQVRNDFARDMTSLGTEWGYKEPMKRFKIDLMKADGTVQNNMPPFRATH